MLVKNSQDSLNISTENLEHLFDLFFKKITLKTFENVQFLKSTWNNTRVLILLIFGIEESYSLYILHSMAVARLEDI